MKSICAKSNQNSWIGGYLEDAAMTAADKALLTKVTF